VIVRANTPAQELEAMEDQRDLVSAMLARIESANDERFPMALLRRLSRGENPVRVYREHRGLDPQALAAAAGVQPALVAAIEAGHCEPSLRDAAALARALGVDAEDLIPWPQD
jgi:DNA-binding XRE family transcriptional regulator